MLNTNQPHPATVETLLQMEVGQNSIQLIETNFVVARPDRATFRLGEMGGDWLMSGSAEKVVARATKQTERTQDDVTPQSFDAFVNSIITRLDAADAPSEAARALAASWQ